MDELKQSRYNYRFQVGDQWIYFNGVTKKMIPIPHFLHDLVESYLETPEKCKQESPTFLASMLDAGLLIKAGQDELEVIREQYSELRNEASYQLMLTLDGGFVGSLHPGDVLEQHSVMESLKVHLERYIHDHAIKQLRLEWIEKSTHATNDEVMKTFSSFADQLCKREKIHLSLHLTLPNALFEEDRLIKLFNGLPLQSIRMALSIEPQWVERQRDALIRHLRVVMDRFPSLLFVFFVQETAYDAFLSSLLSGLNAMIPISERQRITFFVHDDEWQHLHNQETRGKMLFALNRDGYNLQWNGVLPSLCMAEKRHAFVMNGFGDAAKCLATLDSSVHGYLSSHGNVFWDETTVRAENEIPFFENIRCLSCKHLPVCMGQCISAERTTEVDVDDQMECLLPPWYISPEQIIELYCKQRLDRYLNEGNVHE
ncbi:MAG: SPASM domain-containing protein [Microbacter sp.]